MKSHNDILVEITNLKSIKPRVRRYSIFNDDNWRAIDAQIQVLSVCQSREEVYDEFPEEDELDQLDSALDAINWLLEENDAQAPSEIWKELVR